MVVLNKYKNKNIAIYGMGRSGCSAAKKLKELKANIFCWDDKNNIRKKINFPLEKFWLKKNYNIDHIVISPGIDIKNCKIKKFLLKNSKKIITDLDIFFEINKNIKIISITGTNGKSTTCKILESIFKKAGYKVFLGGNIGKPVLSFKITSKKIIFILEVSSYQLEYSKIFHTNHAAILNISPDHLERHKNILNYIKIKTRIFSGQRSSDFSYINFTNKYFKFIKNEFKRKKIKSKLIHINQSNFKKIIKRINNKYFNSKGNLENLCFSYKIAKNFHINDKIIFNALNHFTGLPHRQEIVFQNKYVTCVNDSKATSFDACFQSLSVYSKIYWIVGGLPKDHDRFNFKNISKNIIKAYIIGKKALFFKKQIPKNISFQVSNTLHKALKNIYKDFKKNQNFGATVLLSPAAASFDQFKDFEERGDIFKNLVKNKFRRVRDV